MKMVRSLALLVFVSVGSVKLCTAVPDTIAGLGLTFRLFAPIPRDHTQFRLANMREKIAERVDKGELFNTAYMKEVRSFILTEVAYAIQVVADIKHIQVDAAQYAQVFVENRLGSMLDEDKDPNTLPLCVFTYYLSPYLIPVFMRTGLPEMTRDFNPLTLIQWAHSAYLFLDYVEKGCEAIKSGMAAAGLKPA